MTGAVKGSQFSYIHKSDIQGQEPPQASAYLGPTL